MKKAIFLIGFFSLLLAPYKSVFACSCVPPGDPQEELAQADAVFSGQVIELQKIPVPGYKGTHSSSATFWVEEAWKGINTRTACVL